jgi:diacylglycerol kinase (ATP)
MFSFKKLSNSFAYAFKGIKQTFLLEQNMRIHIFVSIIVIICGFLFQISIVEWMFISLCIGLVFAAEMFNTAIENMVDYISLEKHPLAGKIKDLSAAAVLVCAFAAMIVGLLIFIPKIIC